jgi:hypothetical protein
MLSREELRHQINLRIFGSPATLLPLLGGGAALVSPIFFSIAPAIPVFIGISGIVAAGGNVLIQSLLSRDKIIREIVAEADSRDQEARSKTLNALYSKLAGDGDTRTHKLLSDLRALVDAVHDGDWQNKINAAASADILRGVDALFSGTVRRLERTIDLTKMIRKIDTPAAKQNLVAERERLVDEVVASVAQLSAFLAKLNSVTVSGESVENLGAIVQGLERDLGFAERSAQQADSLTASSQSSHQPVLTTQAPVEADTEPPPREDDLET